MGVGEVDARALARADAPMDPAKHNGLPVPQRCWAVFTVAVAITMSVLDGAMTPSPAIECCTRSFRNRVAKGMLRHT
jgi:hypothetical protein